MLSTLLLTLLASTVIPTPSCAASFPAPAPLTSPSTSTARPSTSSEQAANAVVHSGPSRRSGKGYEDPRNDGGTMLTTVEDTYPAGLGEPLNIIISGNSDTAVLVDSEEDGGFRNYFLSLNFSSECLNVYNPGGQKANLGDGQGLLNQTAEIRYNFGDYYFGTCRETFNGGGHFRYWTQKTTGAYFMAASMEMDLSKGHDIIPNGYDLGRDEIVGYAVYGNTSLTIPTLNVTNQTTFFGSTSYNNYTYLTSVEYVSNLLSNSSDGINHYLTVEEDGRPAIDGLVAVFTIKITASPAVLTTAISSSFRTLSMPSTGLIFPLASSLFFLVSIAFL